MCEKLNRDYTIREEIGRGRFAVVYRCFSASSGRPFACKSIDKRLLFDTTDLQCVQKEPKINQFLSGNPNILQIHNIYEDDNYLHLIFDLCDSPTLFDRITQLSESQASRCFMDLITAIAYCHHSGIAHRDVKPENVLFDSSDRLKLADFGSAEWFGCGNETMTMSGIVGTPYYVAPEILSGEDYNEKVDVWSCGVILYIMLSGGVPPFSGDSPEEIFDKVLRGNLRFPTRIFRSVSSEAKDLLRKMLCKDPSRRLSADQVVRHPWVMNGGESVNDMN